MNTFRQSPLWKVLDASLAEWTILIVCVGVLVWLVVRVRSWFREDEDPTASAHEMLLQFRDLRRQGDLSEEEYRSIKNRLVEERGDARGKGTRDS